VIASLLLIKDFPVEHAALIVYHILHIDEHPGGVRRIVYYRFVNLPEAWCIFSNILQDGEVSAKILLCSSYI
jgi:hypothetical protein